MVGLVLVAVRLKSSSERLEVGSGGPADDTLRPSRLARDPTRPDRVYQIIDQTTSPRLAPKILTLRYIHLKRLLIRRILAAEVPKTSHYSSKT